MALVSNLAQSEMLSAERVFSDHDTEQGAYVLPYGGAKVLHLNQMGLVTMWVTLTFFIHFNNSSLENF